MPKFVFHQVCKRKILTVGRDLWMASSYTSVAHMAPFYVFPCGHGFHAQCLIAHVTRCTDEAQVSLQCKFIRDSNYLNDLSCGGFFLFCIIVMASFHEAVCYRLHIGSLVYRRDNCLVPGREWDFEFLNSIGKHDNCI